MKKFSDMTKEMSSSSDKNNDMTENSKEYEITCPKETEERKQKLYLKSMILLFNI